AAIRALDERGVLHSIASKNDRAEALAALKQFGLDEYFLHPQIHWEPKSLSIGRIAAALDLGIDTFLFIDDQPFERAEAEAGNPGLRVVPETAAATLTSHPWFDLPITPESKRRRQLYREEAQRSSAYEAAGGDYLGFLRGSRLTLDVAPLTSADA